MRAPTAYTAADGTVTYRVRFRTEGGRQSSETFPTRAEAEKFASLHKLIGLDAALAQLGIDATITAGARDTLNAVAADHIDNHVNGLAGTKLKYHRTWAKTWAPLIGTVPASEVTHDTLKDAMAKLIARTDVPDTRTGRYSEKTLKNFRGLLHGVCKRAIDRGLLARDPRTHDIHIPRGDESQDIEMVIVEPEDYKRLSPFFHRHYRPFFDFLYGTGCRYGEAVALRCGEVYVWGNKREVYFVRALKDSPDGKREVGNTKSPKGKRHVMVNAELGEMLAELIKGKGPNDLVFTAPRGGPIRHRTVSSFAWYPALMRAGMTGAARPRIHDLRHSHITNLLSRGVSYEVVQDRVGHESVLTLMRYRHVLPAERAAAAHAADLAFG